MCGSSLWSLSREWSKNSWLEAGTTFIFIHLISIGTVSLVWVVEKTVWTKADRCCAPVEPLLVGDVLMVLHTGSRQRGWKEPGRCEESGVGRSYQLSRG